MSAPTDLARETPSGELPSMSARTRAASAGSLFKVVGPRSFGSISSATAATPFEATRSSIFWRPSRAARVSAPLLVSASTMPVTRAAFRRRQAKTA